MNVKNKDLEKVLKILPAMQKPTIAQLSDKDWVDVDTILDEKGTLGEAIRLLALREDIFLATNNMVKNTSNNTPNKFFFIFNSLI